VGHKNVRRCQALLSPLLAFPLPLDRLSLKLPPIVISTVPVLTPRCHFRDAYENKSHAGTIDQIHINQKVRLGTVDKT
jgi:hypothetical protein